MSQVYGGLQQIGDLKAKMGLYASPIVAIMFCVVGLWIVKLSKAPPSPKSPSPSPSPQPPPASMGYLFICLGFFVPFLAYGIYKLTMASPMFAAASGAGTVFNIAKSI